jgi:hypothetical protein
MQSRQKWMQSAEQDDPPKHKTSRSKGISPGSGWFFPGFTQTLLFTKTQAKKRLLDSKNDRIKQPSFPE